MVRERVILRGREVGGMYIRWHIRLRKIFDIIECDIKGVGFNGHGAGPDFVHGLIGGVWRINRSLFLVWF